MNAKDLWLVWAGRYQPFHLAHAQMVERALLRFEEPQLLLILDSATRLAASGVPVKYRAERNPFTLWERYTLATAFAESLGAIARTMRILTGPLPTEGGSNLQSYLPPRYVRGITDKDEEEQGKQSWPGEDPSSFRIFSVADLPPPVTSTAMRKAIRDGQPWQRFVPEPCQDYFESINGPERWLAIP